MVKVIGAGLAGSEACWQLANRGVKVQLFEMRGKVSTPAHQTSLPAELVCSNTFRSDDISNAVGLLHHEMRELNSLIMEAADATRIPAGSALAVDRIAFSEYVKKKLTNHPNIEIINEEISTFPEDATIVATGPLTSDSLSAELLKIIEDENSLAFFDAIAPIIAYDSINFDIAWKQSRYDKGDDYINCPLNKEQYYNFVEELLQAEKISFKEWEQNTPYFNGCLPIEVIAERGKDSLRFGTMKPVGLTNPHQPEQKPYAVIQLRQDNTSGSLYNMVGFQTKMKYGEQQRIFKTIPGLENAEFHRLGGLHRNTFINSPSLLDATLKMKSQPNLRFAGQITGVEGYLESAAIGMLAGIFQAFELDGKQIEIPETTSLGALLKHITHNANSKTFQPMNINFGLFSDFVEEGNRKFKNKHDKRSSFVERAIEDIKKLKKDLG